MYLWKIIYKIQSKKWREAEFQITKMLYTAAAKAASYIITRQCSA